MTARRAFALPLVILLTLVISLGLALILNRSGSSNAAINQQIRVYQQHHRHAGMKEMVDRWLATTHGSMRDQLESDGQAFTLEMPRNARVRVTITDGQGTLLDDLRGLYGPEARYTAIALDAIRRAVGPDEPHRAERFFRKAGPAAVSINTAAPEVIEAITTAIVPGREGQRIATEYIARRMREVIEQPAIRAIALEMGAPNEEAAALELMFTANPTVWSVDAVGTISNRVVERSGGLIEIVTDPNSGSTVGVGSRTRFLTWDDLPIP
jgi:hypothetical protein